VGPEDADADGFVSGLLAQPLTADAAVQVALLRSRELQAVYEDLGVAQADLVHAGLLRNPDLAGFFRIPDRGPSGVNWNVGLDLWLDVSTVPSGAHRGQRPRRGPAASRTRYSTRRHASASPGTGSPQITPRGGYQRALADFAAAARDIAEQQFPLGHIPEIELARERLAAEEAAITLDQAESAARDQPRGARETPGSDRRPPALVDRRE
jgi:cobalt-zinc-cadmium efflux system outer membrane protein